MGGRAQEGGAGGASGSSFLWCPDGELMVDMCRLELLERNYDLHSPVACDVKCMRQEAISILSAKRAQRISSTSGRMAYGMYR